MPHTSLPPDELATRGKAIAAASQAADAIAELLRFAREGEGINAIFEIEVVEQLLDAVKMAIEIEGEQSSHHAIYGDICSELEFWVNGG